MTTTNNQQGESVDLDKLEALAKAATPGPWTAVDAPGAGLEIYADVPSQIGMDSRQWPAFSTANADCKKDLIAYETWVQFPSEKLKNVQARNAAYIAAANPATILALIAQARASQPAASDAQPGADERALFEAWYGDNYTTYLPRMREGKYAGEYVNSGTQMIWHAWQARAALATPVVQPGADQQARKALERIANGLDEKGPRVIAAEALRAMEKGIATPAVQAGATVAACDLPPPGWYCTRTPGHTGPCAAHEGNRNGEKEYARSDNQGAAQDEAHDAGRSGTGGGVGTDEHHEHRAGQSSADGHDGGEDGGSAGVSDRGEVREPVAAPASPATQAADTDARDAARGKWLIERGFKYANVDMTSDGDDTAFVVFHPRFYIPEPAGMPYDNGEWTVHDIRAAIDAAMSASVSEADGSGKGGVA